MSTRRTFLKQASAATAVGLLTPRSAGRLWAVPPGDVLPEPDEALLRELALKAVDAARTAGATFADLRMVATRAVRLMCTYNKDAGQAPGMESPILDVSTCYGVRALVGGAWGFACGWELTPEAVSRAARSAVATARATPPRRRRGLELAPKPTVPDGRWATPIAEDPFAISIREQGQLGLAAIEAALQVPEVIEAKVWLHWRQPLCVFADTDGSLIVQRHTYTKPTVDATARVDGTRENEAVDLPIGGYGYEAIRAATLPAELRQAAERAVARARTATANILTPVEAGRYDLVLSPAAVADILVVTLFEATNAERAFGYMTNGAGTSFAAPPGDILGKYQVGSPLLTVRADRSRPRGAATTGWDEEGVKPEDYTLVQDGIIVDYQTTRQTAAELAGWYRGRGEPVRSHGVARGTGVRVPSVQVPNLTVVPDKGSTTVEDMIAQTRRGFYVEGRPYGLPDQQVISAQFAVWDNGPGQKGVRQIVNGKLGGYVKHFAFQCFTPQFWKSLDALGGTSSAQVLTLDTDPAADLDITQPFPCSTGEVVPARFRQVNVLNIGTTA